MRTAKNLGALRALEVGGTFIVLLSAALAVGCAGAAARELAAPAPHPAGGAQAAISGGRRIAADDLRMRPPVGSIGAPARGDDGDDGARLALAFARDAAERAMSRGDYPAAETILGAALAMNESSAPLLNQLALAYLAGATSTGLNGNTAMLELARAACERAISIDPGSAPAQNTLGLIHARLHSYAAALVAFDRARDLDKALFEAHFNAAALRLRFYAYADAERGYRDALRVRPSDYEAKVGLALALRSQLDGDASLFEARLREAERLLDEAITSSPARPEAYLNQALLLLDTANGVGMPSWESTIQKARVRLRSLLAMDGDAPELLRAKAAAQAALQGVDDATHCDFRTSEKERKEREVRRRQEAAEAEIKAAEGAAP